MTGQLKFVGNFPHRLTVSPALAQEHDRIFLFHFRLNGSSLSTQQFVHVRGHASLTPGIFLHRDLLLFLFTQSHDFRFVRSTPSESTFVTLNFTLESLQIAKQRCRDIEEKISNVIRI